MYTCECSDKLCPACHGNCDNDGIVALVRIDMDSAELFLCEECAADAMESGLFEDVSNPPDGDEIVISDLNDLPAIIEQCNREKFWPDILHVNDHGNTDLLSVNFDTGEYSIVRSWV